MCKRPSKSIDTIAMLLAFVVVFFLGDWVIARINIPQVLNGTNSCRWKWELYEQAPFTPNVAFLGSCYGLFGINSQILSQTARESGRELSVMNLCTSSASMYTQYLYARHIVNQPKKPDLVYLEVGPWGTLDVDAESLAHGIRVLGDVTDLPMAASLDGGLFAECIKASVFSSYLHWADSRRLAKHFAMGAPLVTAPPIIFDESGWGRFAKPFSRDMDDTVSPMLNGPDPAKGHASFTERNPNATALRRTVRMLRDASVAVRFLEMPRRSDAPVWFDPANHAEYQAFINKASAELGVAVVRVPPGVVSDLDYFTQLHLNEDGAAKFSRWLARDVRGL